MSKLVMVQITFTKKAGGKPIYVKAAADEAEAFRKNPLALCSAEGHLHTFTPGVIRDISIRPYDPTHSHRSQK